MDYSNKLLELNPKVLDIINKTESLDYAKSLVFLFLFEYSNKPITAFPDPKKMEVLLHSNGLLARDYDSNRHLKPRHPLFIKKIDEFKWVKEYRSLFSSKALGISGKMGDPNSCAKKMKEFLKVHDYDKDTILEATKLYISKTNPKYLRRADYFISKEKQGSGAISDLLIWCEELEDNGGIIENPFEIQA